MSLRTQIPNWGMPGHVNQGHENEFLIDRVVEINTPGWTSYTPGWESDGTDPTIGNGSWTGSEYRVTDDGDICHFTLALTFGSTTTLGTGTFYGFQLPVSPTRTHANGPAWLADASSGARRLYHWFYFPGTAFTHGLVIAAESPGNVGPGAPWTWATSDTIYLNGWYRV